MWVVGDVSRKDVKQERLRCVVGVTREGEGWGCFFCAGAKPEIGSIQCCTSSTYTAPPALRPAYGLRFLSPLPATSAMSGKYAFTKTLKELRFLHCQTSEHSNAVRYVLPLQAERTLKSGSCSNA